MKWIHRARRLSPGFVRPHESGIPSSRVWPGVWAEVLAIGFGAASAGDGLVTGSSRT